MYLYFCLFPCLNGMESDDDEDMLLSEMEYSVDETCGQDSRGLKV